MNSINNNLIATARPLKGSIVLVDSMQPILYTSMSYENSFSLNFFCNKRNSISWISPNEIEMKFEAERLCRVGEIWQLGSRY